jgi:hypothetical protein
MPSNFGLSREVPTVQLGDPAPSAKTSNPAIGIARRCQPNVDDQLDVVHVAQLFHDRPRGCERAALRDTGRSSLRRISDQSSDSESRLGVQTWSPAFPRRALHHITNTKPSLSPRPATKGHLEHSVSGQWVPGQRKPEVSALSSWMGPDVWAPRSHWHWAMLARCPAVVESIMMQAAQAALHMDLSQITTSPLIRVPLFLPASHRGVQWSIVITLCTVPHPSFIRFKLIRVPILVETFQQLSVCCGLICLWACPVLSPSLLLPPASAVHTGASGT